MSLGVRGRVGLGFGLENKERSKERPKFGR